MKSEQALRTSEQGSFVEGVEAVRQLEEVVREPVWAEVVQDCRHNLGELAEAFREDELGGSVS